MVSHRVMSLSELLTPPAGACGLRVAHVVGLVPVVEVDVADGAVGPAMYSSNRELVDVMPSGLYSTS